MPAELFGCLHDGQQVLDGCAGRDIVPVLEDVPTVWSERIQVAETLSFDRLSRSIQEKDRVETTRHYRFATHPLGQQPWVGRKPETVQPGKLEFFRDDWNEMIEPPAIVKATDAGKGIVAPEVVGNDEFLEHIGREHLGGIAAQGKVLIRIVPEVTNAALNVDTGRGHDVHKAMHTIRVLGHPEKEVLTCQRVRIWDGAPPEPMVTWISRG